MLWLPSRLRSRPCSRRSFSPPRSNVIQLMSRSSCACRGKMIPTDFAKTLTRIDRSGLASPRQGLPGRRSCTPERCRRQFIDELSMRQAYAGADAGAGAAAPDDAASEHASAAERPLSRPAEGFWSAVRRVRPQLHARAARAAYTRLTLLRPRGRRGVTRSADTFDALVPRAAHLRRFDQSLWPLAGERRR